MVRVGAVILVRHAHAGNKALWRQADELRPLTVWGLAQAASLVGTLAQDNVSVVWSSPAVRCRQTVQLLAARRGVSVQDHPLLAKDATADALLDWVLADPSEPWVLCTHGEVLRELLVVARASGSGHGTGSRDPEGRRMAHQGTRGRNHGTAVRTAVGARSLMLVVTVDQVVCVPRVLLTWIEPGSVEGVLCRVG